MNFLIKENFVFFSDERENFISINNNWASPEIINNAIIEYDLHNLIKSTLDQLDDLNCKFIELRFLL